MKVLRVAEEGWDAALRAVSRHVPDWPQEVEDIVRTIIREVRERGDEALLDLGRRFDCPSLASLIVSREEWTGAADQVSNGLRLALERAARSIEAFHRAQVRSSWFQDSGGALTGQLLRPFERVGVYVPGGRASYPSTVLMCAIPAAVAGVAEIIVCTPACRDGSVSPLVLYAARLAGVRAVYKVGGAQAIAAMAYGTDTVPRVDKIVGPGNTYVCVAKKMLWGVADMDMLAGPSEVCVVADEYADPRLIAADLLTQAEHDPQCAVFLLTPSRAIAEAALAEVDSRLAALPRKEILRRVLDGRSACVITRSLDEAVELANACAPEHLALHVADAFRLLAKVRNAGAVMLGGGTPQTVGDYMAGPSHTLPTGGTARFWSPLTVDSFMKKTSFMAYTDQALATIADDLMLLARAEGFDAHADAVAIRLEQHGKTNSTEPGDDSTR